MAVREIVPLVQVPSKVDKEFASVAKSAVRRNFLHRDHLERQAELTRNGHFETFDPHNVYGMSGFKPGAIYEVLYRQMGGAFPQTSAQLWRIAQLEERLTEKPNAILTRVQVPGAVRDFSTKVNFRCKLSYGVRTTPMCNRTLQHLCAC